MKQFLDFSVPLIDLFALSPSFAVWCPFVRRNLGRSVMVCQTRPGLYGKAFNMDIWYVDYHNLKLDLKIIAMTLHKVLASNGIKAEGEKSMPTFTGWQSPANKDSA